MNFKFKEGEKVVITSNIEKGRVGEILQSSRNDNGNVYIVGWDDDKALVFFENELAPYVEPTPVVTKEEVKTAVEENMDMFIAPQKPDRNAACQRKIDTEEMLDTWRMKINRTNTRGLSYSHIKLYQEAYDAINAVIEQEALTMLDR